LKKYSYNIHHKDIVLPKISLQGEPVPKHSVLLSPYSPSAFTILSSHSALCPLVGHLDGNGGMTTVLARLLEKGTAGRVSKKKTSRII